jgi:AmiR/NasT family two-component response regulator
MGHRGQERLRVLIANERPDRLAPLVSLLAGLGHEVIVHEEGASGVAAVTARERPDVALVGRGESSQHALEMIDGIVREAACPVIALSGPDPAFVQEASAYGIFAAINHDDVDGWQSAIDIVLRRFAEYHELEGAFARRATTERAKGILMERHDIDDRHAFALLRDHARATRRSLVEVAAAVADGRALLPKRRHS